MNVSLYQAAAAMNAQMRWQEVIAQNLASSAVPGFKKEEVAFRATAVGKLPVPSDASGPDNDRFAMPTVSVVTSFRPGEIKLTGSKTDLAVDGPGFFEVQMPDGTSAFTRDGEFHLSPEGQLVTKSGYPVSGGAGSIQIDRNNPAPLSVSATGEVSQGGAVRGRLRLVEFGDPKELARLGGGYFKATPEAGQNSDAPNSSIRQGMLEVANTSAVQEMTSLIAAMRSFEANQRIIQMQDERMGKAIHELSGN